MSVAESGKLSVVVRLPVNVRESPTSRGVIQQLHIALSLLMEDKAALRLSLANRTTLYGTAIHTIHKILESGHCSKCAENKTECNFCRALVFRDFIEVNIQGKSAISISNKPTKLRLMFVYDLTIYLIA